jgi:5-methylcytosine-specific restriction endonuclease McrA
LLQDIVILDSDREDDGVPALNVMAHKARALLGGPLSERKAPSKRLPGESKAAKRERRRAEHREETARIRKAVFERAGGRCEGDWFVGGLVSKFDRCFRVPTELHHLVSGSGRRRQQQTVENTRALCLDCHRAAHRAGARETEGGEPA